MVRTRLRSLYPGFHFWGSRDPSVYTRRLTPARRVPADGSTRPVGFAVADSVDAVHPPLSEVVDLASGETIVVMEAAAVRQIRGRERTQVPLADEPGLVVRTGQQLGQQALALRHSRAIRRAAGEPAATTPFRSVPHRPGTAAPPDAHACAAAISHTTGFRGGQCAG